jgi:hypothetical protein
VTLSIKSYSYSRLRISSTLLKFDFYAEILIEQAEQATQEATHWQQVAANTRKSHNKNHYQAMLDDTNNIYFYRFVGDVAIDVVLVTNGITIINIINLTGGA